MANCDECKQSKNVSWAYVELLNDGHKSSIRKLWVLVIILIVALAASNLAWLYVWQQYDYETIEYSQDGRGINIIGDDNDSRQWQYGTDFEDTTENP